MFIIDSKLFFRLKDFHFLNFLNYLPVSIFFITTIRLYPFWFNRIYDPVCQHESMIQFYIFPRTM